MLTVGILIFDEVEVMDFAGPFEVFSTASRLQSRAGNPLPFRVLTISSSTAMVRARGGLAIQSHHRFGEHSKLDVVVVPGGDVTAPLGDGAVRDWIAQVAADAQLMAAVCTGAFLLAASGLLDGRRATTHWEDLEDLKASFPQVRVASQLLWVDEGDVVTSAGISAGIDMSLHLVERLTTADLAFSTARQMDYEWRDERGNVRPRKATWPPPS